MKIDLYDGSFIDTEKPTLRIQAFKASGKWYSSCSTIITDDLKWILEKPWELAEIIKHDGNNPQIRGLSPLSSGFPMHMYFVLDAFVPENEQGFCTMLVDNTVAY